MQDRTPIAAAVVFHRGQFYYRSCTISSSLTSQMRLLCHGSHETVIFSYSKKKSYRQGSCIPDTWRIRINAYKCQLTNFNKKSPQPTLKITISDSILEWIYPSTHRDQIRPCHDLEPPHTQTYCFLSLSVVVSNS